MRFRLPLSAMVSMLLLSCSMPAFGDRKYASDSAVEVRIRMTAPLKAAGFQETKGDLKRALRHENAQVRTAAAFVLGEQDEIDPESMEALRVSLDDSVQSVVVWKAWALHQHGDRTWIPRCVHVLDESRGKKSLLSIRAAGLLAEAGRPDGWLIVRSALSSKDPAFVAEACTASVHFDGLRQTQDKGEENTADSAIDVLKLYVETFPKVTDELQMLLISAIGRLGRSIDPDEFVTLKDGARSPNVEQALKKVVRIGRE